MELAIFSRAQLYESTECDRCRPLSLNQEQQERPARRVPLERPEEQAQRDQRVRLGQLEARVQPELQALPGLLVPGRPGLREPRGTLAG